MLFYPYQQSANRRTDMKVVITDDTLRRNSVQTVTQETRANFAMAGNPLPDDVKILPLKDRSGRQIQETVCVDHVYEGRVLDLAVIRAKRWMRSGKFPGTGAPHHIALAMAAFHKADPEGFNRILKSRGLEDPGRKVAL